MEDLERLNTVLGDIQRLCLAIKKETLSVMKTVQNEGLDIAKDIHDIKPYLDLQTIIKMLQQFSLSLLGDVETISSEIGPLSVALANGTDLQESSLVILKDVWFGDAFDGKTGHEGLLALKYDLEKQLGIIELDTVLNKILKIEES